MVFSFKLKLSFKKNTDKISVETFFFIYYNSVLCLLLKDTKIAAECVAFRVVVLSTDIPA